jgi:NmrA-like family protein
MKLEEEQGKAFIDGALANGVQFFVYASSDRGGENSYDTVTGVAHFDAKRRVEHHLVDNAKGKMQWCILRPVAFMEVSVKPELIVFDLDNGANEMARTKPQTSWAKSWVQYGNLPWTQLHRCSLLQSRTSDTLARKLYFTQTNTQAVGYL